MLENDTPRLYLNLDFILLKVNTIETKCASGRRQDRVVTYPLLMNMCAAKLYTLAFILAGSTTVFGSTITGDPSLSGASLAISYDLRADTSAGQQASNSMTSQTGPISDANSISGTNAQGYSFASVSERASFAGLGVSASGGATPSSPLNGIVGDGYGQATASDTFSVPGAAGDTLSVTATFSGTGAYAGTFNVGNNIGVSLQIGTNGPSCGQSFQNVSGPASYTCTVTYAIGQDPILVTLGLNASGGAEYGSASVDALDTLKISAVSILDKNGNPVNNAVIFDASGFDYNQSAAAAPEVGSFGFAAIGMGLVCLVVLTRSKKLVG